MKKRVLVVTPGNITIPAVRGGAHATRFEDIAICNEEFRELELTIVSMYDESAAERAKAYKNTRFLYITLDDIRERRYRNNLIIRFINRISLKLRGLMLITPPRMRQQLALVDDCEYDAIIGAGGNLEEYSDFTRRYGREKMIFNVGGHLRGSKIASSVFGNFFCCSDYIRNYMSYNIGPNTNVKGILHRINYNLFAQDLDGKERERLQDKYQIHNKFVYVFFGRISPEKGISQLLEAYEHISNDNKNHCLMIIGSVNFGYEGTTEYETEVATRISKNPNIITTGYIHHDDLWKIVKLANVAVLPSMWEEPSGNVVPEAMAAGLPVIITNSGGMVEYVDDESAIIVNKEKDVVTELASAMELLYNNPGRAKEMGRHASEKAKEYDMRIYYRLICDEFLQMQ